MATPFARFPPLARRPLLVLLAGGGTAGPAARFGSDGLPARGAVLDRRGLRATFADDFSRFAAAPERRPGARPAWRTTYFGGDRTLPANREAQWYADPAADGPFAVTPEGLAITAAPYPGLPQGLTHRSGLITSQFLLTQQYGYFEMRARLPRGRGMWPAFWLLPADGAWPPEIDVMEMLGHAPATYYVALHARPGGSARDEVTARAGPDLASGFHVFGLAWRADRLRWYLDDRLVHEAATPADLHRPMYMLANLAVGAAGSWPGAAAAEARGTMVIGWIRAWQFAGDRSEPAK